MPQLPLVSGQQVLKVFVNKFGYEIARRKGSHVTIIKKGNPLIITVPLHDQLDRGTLRSILRKADIPVEDFVKEV